MRTRTAALLALITLAVTANAAAQESPTEIARRELIAQAEAARRAGDHPRALELAQRAGAVRWTASLRLLAAQEHAALAHPLDAYGMAQACAREAEADSAMRNRDRILTACRELAASLEHRVGRVVVRSPHAPAGLRIRVAGAELPEALWGIAFPVMPGAVALDANAPAHGAMHREVTVAANDVQEVAVELDALPEGATTATESASFNAPGAPVVAPDDAARSRAMRTAGWVGVGLAGVALGVGAAYLGLWVGGQAGYTRDCPAAADCQSRSDASVLQSSVAWAGMSVGAAVGVGSVVLLVLARPSAQAAQPQHAWSCVPQLGSAGVECGGRF